MNKSILIVIALSIIIGIFIGWGIKPTPKCPEPKTEVDTVYTTITIRDTNYKPKFYTLKDTSYKSEQRTLEDTSVSKSQKVFQLPPSFRKIPPDTVFIKNVYVAEVDTVFEDNLLSGKVSYISDIPLLKDSYFKMNFNVKTKEVIKTITIPEEPSFWYKRFVPYIGIGLSYSEEETIRPSIQLGIGIRLN